MVFLSMARQKRSLTYLDTYLQTLLMAWTTFRSTDETMVNGPRKIGFSAHIHAIGDGAVRESLDAIERT